MNRSLEFSVLMAVYKHDSVDYFKEAIYSVFNNTLTPKELILVVDGPISERMLSTIRDMEKLYPVKPILCDTNRGLAVALNEGLNHITTNWVARADPDDINALNRFQLQVDAILANPAVKIVGGNIEEVDLDLTHICYKNVPLDHLSILEYSRSRNPFNHMSVMYEKDVILRLGGYPNVYLKEDYALWATLLSNNYVSMNLSCLLVKARTGSHFFRRRSGFKYAKAEILLQTLLVGVGLKTKPEAVLDFFTRSIVFLLPAFVRKFIYLSVLRKWRF